MSIDRCWNGHFYDSTTRASCPTCEEMDARNAELAALREGMQRLKADCERKDKALRPFASLANEVYRDREHEIVIRVPVDILLSDLDAAKAALAPAAPAMRAPYPPVCPDCLKNPCNCLAPRKPTPAEPQAPADDTFIPEYGDGFGRNGTAMLGENLKPPPVGEKPGKDKEGDRA